MASLFGFEIKRKKTKGRSLTSLHRGEENIFDAKSELVPAGTLSRTHQLVNFDTTFEDAALIDAYRHMVGNDHVSNAIDEIINDAIVTTESGDIVHMVLDKIDNKDLSKQLKEKFNEEFEYVKGLLDFRRTAYEIFRLWYIDGRVAFHKVVDSKKPRDGIQCCEPLDPRGLKKITEVVDLDKVSVEAMSTAELKKYWIYDPSRRFEINDSNFGQVWSNENFYKLYDDSVTYVTSGLKDLETGQIISYLHSAMKRANQLQQLEDSVIIYYLTRAPERRVFYVDVGQMPHNKAEEYIKSLMAQYKNKMTYDTNTGQIDDARDKQHMMEDFWMARREGGRGTEIDVLGGGSALQDGLDTLFAFKDMLYQSLKIPKSRLVRGDEGGFETTRVAEITRDELKFQKFILRLRTKFSEVFLDLLKSQVVLKNIVSESEFDDIVHMIYFDWDDDSVYTESREHELWERRLNLLRDAEEIEGKYVSVDWVRKTILRQDDEEIKRQDDQIKKEKGNEQLEQDAFDDGSDYASAAARSMAR